MPQGSQISAIASRRVLSIPLPMPDGGKRVCFIACPFDTESLLIADVIKSDLADRFRVQLHHQRQDGGQFRPKVIDSIHHANLIVALVNKPEEDKANANVLYEIGLAHSLCKPVIAITDKPTCVPANIHTYEWVEYSRNEENFREILTQRIRQRIDNLCDDWRPFWVGSYVSECDYRVVLATLIQAMAICEAALNGFHATASGHTDTLSEHALRMAYGIDFADSFKQFRDNYDEYKNFFNKRSVASLKSKIAFSVTDAKKALLSLEVVSDSKERALLVGLKQRVYLIDLYREGLLDLHERYLTFVDEFIESGSPQDHERRETIYTETKRLQAAYKQPIIELTRYAEGINDLFNKFAAVVDERFSNS